MKHIHFKRCEYNGCKASVYAEGLCYKHFVQKINKENAENNKNESFVSRCIQLAIIVVCVVIWLVGVALSVSVGLECYKLQHDIAFIILAGVVIIAFLMYLIINLILYLTERIMLLRYFVFLVMLVALVFLILKSGDIISAYPDVVKELAKSMKGILHM